MHPAADLLGFRCSSCHLPPQLHPAAGSLCSWMGHGTMWILTAHAVLYYVYWATSKTAGGCVASAG